ncbi:hypothetical protein [Nocardia seriolae]|uniref:hypothetical protein n=1 Tax=Nocardia seriolae TaxID=37332 RepID=UPI0011604FEC|nr:hypothetical protein [Nocardia seriolae]QOW36712.1 hypothetical protein IMZ23_18815 [Nocardia seriolae]QUN15772.1 hypothetical protein KEC46_26085 [Nocardia seriolae]WKY54606.1 hypothetical protein Q5P07_11525 [Nocardia seriolae]WNJ57200.1 hypothetical protein RMO66_27725 [Nocardia seriolae]
MAPRELLSEPGDFEARGETGTRYRLGAADDGGPVEEFVDRHRDQRGPDAADTAADAVPPAVGLAGRVVKGAFGRAEEQAGLAMGEADPGRGDDPVVDDRDGAEEQAGLAMGEPPSCCACRPWTSRSTGSSTGRSAWPM